METLSTTKELVLSKQDRSVTRIILTKMESKHIIKNIKNIYKEYNIPVNLQEHMLRCAAICRLIINHWKGPELNKEDIIATMLIHDMGNIIKFDFESEFNKKVLKKEEIPRLKEIQKEMIKEYSDDSEKADILIAKELEANNKVINLLENLNYELMIETLESSDFDLKISKYSDLRVSPYGVVSIEERHKEAKIRYPDIKIDPKLKEAAFKIETQILDNTDLEPEDINDESIKEFLLFK